MKKYLKLLRVHHYLKNGLIMLPFICGKQLFNWSMWLKVIPGIVAFSLISSVVYIINDIRDADKDRNHPTKCNRPIASGSIKKSTAISIAVILFISSMACNLVTFSHWTTWLILGLYFCLNIGYSLGLKNYPIIDICILVSGFFLRVLYGASITGIELSNWMYLTIMMLSFYMGLGKRRNELLRTKEGETRNVLKYYNHNFLDKFMYLCLTITIIFYSLWCVDPINTAVLGTRLIWTIPVVLAICMKYSLDVESDSDGDPVNVILKDKILMGACGIFAVAFILLMYL